MVGMPISSQAIISSPERRWFSSGRAALVAIMEQAQITGRLWLPSIYCWPVVRTIRNRFPRLAIAMYPVGRDLAPRYPTSDSEADLLLIPHYFGYHSMEPATWSGRTIHDLSHALLAPPNVRTGSWRFASCRKLFPVADGGMLIGDVEADYGAEDRRWIQARRHATSWQEMRAAENLLDDATTFGDISSASLELILGSDLGALAEQRRFREAWMRRELLAGVATRDFQANECAAAHVRTFSSRDERDEFWKHMATRGVFLSRQWEWQPLECVAAGDTHDAIWWAEHHLVFPLGAHLDDSQIGYIISTANDWRAKS
ncbi:MAG: hypothetical protein R3F22_04210 [Lysobacteraceae bacterium]